MAVLLILLYCNDFVICFYLLIFFSLCSSISVRILVWAAAAASGPAVAQFCRGSAHTIQSPFIFNFIVLDMFARVFVYNLIFISGCDHLKLPAGTPSVNSAAVSYFVFEYVGTLYLHVFFVYLNKQSFLSGFWLPAPRSSIARASCSQPVSRCIVTAELTQLLILIFGPQTLLYELILCGDNCSKFIFDFFCFLFCLICTNEVIILFYDRSCFQLQPSYDSVELMRWWLCF